MGVDRGEFRALFEFLDELGVRGAEPAPSALSPVDALLESFRSFLLGERALTVRTAAAYSEGAVRPFLVEHAADGNVAGLTSAVVVGAVRDQAAWLAVATTQRFVCGLRAFLRFCFVTGRTATDLSGAALAVTGRPQSFLPNGISRHDADRLLGSCRGQRRCDRRDYAVLLLLLRLGLRAGEVTGLTLDDIDWRAGEITIRGKGPRIERLPLPCDVGEAIVAYLQHERPVTARRVLFLTALAPIGSLGGSTITQIVRHGCVRAGIAPVGAHRLRHTVGCEMTAAGVPLPEIGQVLRHRQLHSTSIYARVDIERLRQIALAWPGGDRDE